MQFQYLAKDRQGKNVGGLCEGDTAMAVRQRLRSQGLFALSVNPASSHGSLNIHVRPSGNAFPSSTDLPSRWSYGVLSFSGNRVRVSDLIVALSQLSIMCQSGDDLAEALKIVSLQCPVPALKKVLSAAYEEVEQGAKFSTALSKHPKVFNESVVAAIAAGEQSGRVVDVLERITRMMRKDQSLRSSVAALMMYPVVLCSITMIVIIAMLFFVLPQFASIFKDMDRPVPPLTDLLLVVGSTLREYWMAFVALVLGLIVAAVCSRKHPRVKKSWDYWVLHFAFTKDALQSLISGRVFRLLGSMLENGVPLLESIRLCRGATANSYFQNMFTAAEQEILVGEGMGKALIDADFLPAGAAHMIATGERTGKLASVLQSIGEYYEDEGERKLRVVVKMLEPAIIVGLGGVVGTVVLSIILPLLDVTTISR
jgi:type II secretory pathway component PulF